MYASMATQMWSSSGKVPSPSAHSSPVGGARPCCPTTIPYATRHDFPRGLCHTVLISQPPLAPQDSSYTRNTLRLNPKPHPIPNPKH